MGTVQNIIANFLFLFLTQGVREADKCLQKPCFERPNEHHWARCFSIYSYPIL